ncbi:helix-turn-helix transcriptional regulator [Variovorax sp. DXTD-1]|uniref:helix-turn-helix transcriptional regulator n=1 Tax=Variovorax sp. DXTD-1 TaxID=2495592 RepID=UPI000F86956F|nr:helix-turn-helix transcriptional regulator [Variovorax sp. DXTD-1]RST54126.1 hypothetical protein EJI00_03090 [Variovorax sp. DXTD-1]
MAPQFSTANHKWQAMLNLSTISIACKMSDAKSEGEALGRRLAGRNKAEFARAHKIPGGPSMLSQNISGNRPISLEAGIAYAKALGCTLAEISPRLAAMVASASDIKLGEVPAPSPPLETALQVLADACSHAPMTVRLNVLELLDLLVKNPAANAEDQIPIIARKLSGERTQLTGTDGP